MFNKYLFLNVWSRAAHWQQRAPFLSSKTISETAESNSRAVKLQWEECGSARVQMAKVRGRVPGVLTSDLWPFHAQREVALRSLIWIKQLANTPKLVFQKCNIKGKMFWCLRRKKQRTNTKKQKKYTRKCVNLVYYLFLSVVKYS